LSSKSPILSKKKRHSSHYQDRERAQEMSSECMEHREDKEIVLGKKKRSSGFVSLELEQM
jgi:hypothetical protein